MVNEVIAIIPARSGSKGVPNKNIRLLSGYPLIAYSIAAAKLSKTITRVIVSTDSEKYAIIAKKFGAEVPFLRPTALSKDSSTDMDYILHAINWFLHKEKKVAQYFALLRPTTPLRDPKIIDEAVFTIDKHKNATSLRSGHPAPETPYKWFVAKGKHYFQPAFKGYTNDEIDLPRQNFPVVYIPDGYIDVIKTTFVLRKNFLLGNKMLKFISPPCHEIDCEEDFEFLSFKIEKKGSVLLDYLKNCYGNKN